MDTITIGTGKAIHLVATNNGTVARETLCGKLTALWNRGELVNPENFTRVTKEATCKTCLKQI